MLKKVTHLDICLIIRLSYWWNQGLDGHWRIFRWENQKMFPHKARNWLDTWCWCNCCFLDHTTSHRRRTAPHVFPVTGSVHLRWLRCREWLYRQPTDIFRHLPCSYSDSALHYIRLIIVCNSLKKYIHIYICTKVESKFDGFEKVEWETAKP